MNSKLSYLLRTGQAKIQRKEKKSSEITYGGLYNTQDYQELDPSLAIMIGKPYLYEGRLVVAVKDEDEDGSCLECVVDSSDDCRGYDCLSRRYTFQEYKP